MLEKLASASAHDSQLTQRAAWGATRAPSACGWVVGVDAGNAGKRGVRPLDGRAVIARVRFWLAARV